MVRVAVHKRTLEFLVQEDGNGWKKPGWKECEVINADCPECRRKMVVIQAQEGIATPIARTAQNIISETKDGDRGRDKCR